MSTTEPTYSVTAILPGEYDQPGEIEVITATSYPRAIAEYQRVVREQSTILCRDGKQVEAALVEAHAAREGAELTCHFPSSWQIELRADKPVTSASPRRLGAKKGLTAVSDNGKQTSPANTVIA